MAPLKSQPGSEFHYSLSTDVLGWAVERASGKSLVAFVAGGSRARCGAAAAFAGSRDAGKKCSVQGLPPLEHACSRNISTAAEAFGPRLFFREMPMNEREEVRIHGVGKSLGLANLVPLAGQPASHEAEASYTDPLQVVEDLGLTIAEKREVLASWASDSRAPHGSPSSRVLDSGALLHVREILEALKSLDKMEGSTDSNEHRWSRLPYARRVRGARDASRRRHPGRGQSEDDDDPPPCPVQSRPPGPLLPPLTAAATAPRYERLPEDAIGPPMTPDAETWRQRNTVAVACESP